MAIAKKVDRQQSFIINNNVPVALGGNDMLAMVLIEDVVLAMVLIENMLTL